MISGTRTNPRVREGEKSPLLHLGPNYLSYKDPDASLGDPNLVPYVHACAIRDVHNGNGAFSRPQRPSQRPYLVC